MAKFCNQCNSPIEEGGKFCTQCGSDDTREEQIESLDETPVESNSSQTDQPIPELETDAVMSFGDKSIENMQKANVQSINSEAETSSMNTQESNTTPEPVAEDQPMQEPKDLQDPPAKNSFADIPDFMTGNESPAMPAHKTPAQRPARPNIKRKPKKNNTLTIIIVAIAIVITITIIGLILYSYSQPGVDETQLPFHSSNNVEVVKDPRSDLDYSEIFTSNNSYRVGDKSLGYISIPKDWSKVVRKDNKDDILQYTDNTSWIVTLMAAPTSEISSINYANSVYYSVQTGGGQELKAQKTRIDGYNAYTVRAMYPTLNKYLTTWCFESRDGKTHYLAIEGPKEDSDYYQIIYSFKEDH